MMRVIRDLDQVNLEKPTVVTIGAFDGLHLGHRALLAQLVRQAHRTERLGAVLTFDPLPRELLAPDSNTTCLMTIEDKVELLEAWGLDIAVILPFTAELAGTSARDFVQMLCQHLHMAELWVGWDFALGRGRTGNVATLQKLGRALGFAVKVVEPVHDGEVVISSTEIRRLIGAGRVREAADMLGRYHELRGQVIHGDGRGSQLGFPTANLEVPAHCAIPSQGVYAVYATLVGTKRPAVANIGIRPTFGPGERTIEVHILDFRRQIYGEEMLIEFVERLRSERCFADQKALCAQIEKDIAQAREILQ
jgi:riboflavin kinase/FMN adenylyltransferase